MKKKSLLLVLPLLTMSLLSCANDDNGGSSEAASSSSSASSTSAKESSSSKSSSSSAASIEAGQFKDIVRVYFHNDAGTEKNKRIYCWITGVSGEEYDWDGTEEGYGVYKDIDLSAPKFIDKVADDFFFIIKSPNTWSGQSEDIKITISDFIANGELEDIDGGRKRLNVYACEESSNAIGTYYHKKEALGARFSSAYLESDWKSLKIEATGKCVSYKLYALGEDYAHSQVKDEEQYLKSYLISEGSPNTDTFTIDLSKCSYPNGKTVEVSPLTTYQIFGSFEDAPERRKSRCVYFDKLFDTEKFIDEYTYSGSDLGVSYSKEATTWKIWSPVSSYVLIRVFDEGTPKALDLTGKAYFADFPSMTIACSYIGNGVYKATYKGDLSGKYYTYRLYYNGSYIDTPDPYAKACGVNGVRSAIVDFSSTNPTGWDNVSYSPISSPTELTAYEVHIRDLTSHNTWKSNKNNERGSYAAFHEAGTRYNGVTTGFDHIKELGVNAVQILPFFDQDNDERTITLSDGTVEKPAYNWGYNPVYYNCLEGAYSSDPYKASTRITEFKELVEDYASSDIRIIMDVVYNHVSSASSHPFSSICPRYFFRYDEEGCLIDDTGCANTVNSSRVMASNFIVESVKWWASEYKIKGFRFDLMGCIETDTMRAVKDALYDIDPSIVVYGEGWTGAGSHASSPSDTYNVYSKLGDNGKGSVGAFNDCYRDGMKGNTLYSDIIPSGGFMSSLSPTEDEIWNAATGMIGENRWKKSSGVATPASMSVNYLSCHDNYTLFDQFNYLLNGVKNCAKSNKNAKDAALSSTANSLLTEGIGFIQGGEEFCRTKLIKKSDPLFDELVSSYKKVNDGTNSWIEGDGVKIDEDTWLVRNSYKYGDEVNGFDYGRKIDNQAYFDKFKEVITLRKESMGTYLAKSQEDIEKGDVTCLGGSAIGGAFVSGSSRRIVITSGRKAGDVNNIPSAFLGEYKVVYCSSSRLAVGSVYTVNATSGLASPFETLVLEK